MPNYSHGTKLTLASIEEPPYLTVGTDVSAKYKGAFCEAKITDVNKHVKLRVLFDGSNGTYLIDDSDLKTGSSLETGTKIEAKHPEKKQQTYVQATITKILDHSRYTVVFDDGDQCVLRRNSLCLKSGKHFAESETLDQLPLTNPEHFGNPVKVGVIEQVSNSGVTQTTINNKALNNHQVVIDKPKGKSSSTVSEETKPNANTNETNNNRKRQQQHDYNIDGMKKIKKERGIANNTDTLGTGSGRRGVSKSRERRESINNGSKRSATELDNDSVDSSQDSGDATPGESNVDFDLIEVGVKLMVQYGKGKVQNVYEAKVNKIETNSAGKTRYFVHYTGWNNRYDEWIVRNRIIGIVTEKENGAKDSRSRQSDKKNKVAINKVVGKGKVATKTGANATTIAPSAGIAPESASDTSDESRIDSELHTDAKTETPTKTKVVEVAKVVATASTPTDKKKTVAATTVEKGAAGGKAKKATTTNVPKGSDKPDKPLVVNMITEAGNPISQPSSKVIVSRAKTTPNAKKPAVIATKTTSISKSAEGTKVIEPIKSSTTAGSKSISESSLVSGGGEAATEIKSKGASSHKNLCEGSPEPIKAFRLSIPSVVTKIVDSETSAAIILTQDGGHHEAAHVMSAEKKLAVAATSAGGPSTTTTTTTTTVTERKASAPSTIVTRTEKKTNGAASGTSVEKKSSAPTTIVTTEKKVSASMVAAAPVPVAAEEKKTTVVSDKKAAAAASGSSTSITTEKSKPVAATASKIEKTVSTRSGNVMTTAIKANTGKPVLVTRVTATEVMSSKLSDATGAAAEKAVTTSVASDPIKSIDSSSRTDVVAPAYQNGDLSLNEQNNVDKIKEKSSKPPTDLVDPTSSVKSFNDHNNISASPSKRPLYKFCEVIDESDCDKKISIIQERIMALRQTYISLKTELAVLDRRRKRPRTERSNSEHISCSLVCKN